MPDDQNTPKSIPQSSEIETYTPKPVLPTEPSSELLSVLAQGLQAQIAVGDYSAIDKIIDLQAKSIAQDQNLRQQEIDLANKKLDQSHEIALKKESNRSSELKDERLTTQKNIRWGLGIFFAIFAASLGYGYVKNDSEIPKTILTLGAGILGGAGVKESLSQGKKSDKENDGK